MRRLVSILIAITCIACAEKPKGPVVVQSAGPMPDSFRVKFETSRGAVVVEVHTAWSPRGAERVRQLASQGFFDENRFFRVLPGYIAQFGVNNDKKLNELWETKPIKDDPRVESNVRGTLTFASDTANTRSHQLFFNLSNNTNLDKQGFTPVGRVVEGMEVVDSIYGRYREKPDYHLLATLGNSYVRRMFPKLDFVKTATVVP